MGSVNRNARVVLVPNVDRCPSAVVDALSVRRARLGNGQRRIAILDPHRFAGRKVLTPGRRRETGDSLRSRQRQLDLVAGARSK